MKKAILSIAVLGGLFFSAQLYAQTETSGREKVYRATHTKVTELKHTKLKVNFDYQKEQMNGEEWLTASPFFYPTNELTLDAKGMLIHEVALDNNGKKSPLKYEYKDDLLKIMLDKTYQKNQDYTVYIKYTARPNEVKQQGSAAINDAKGLYFINAQGKEADKPTQIWTQGETESSSAWFPTIDKPNQKTTQEIYMTVPDKYVTLSNGILKDSKKESDGLRTDHWVMDKRHSTYLFFMGVGEYAIVKDKWRNIPVDYYIEKEYEPYAKQIYGNTPKMIEFFSKKMGYDYPWAKYAQISGRDYVSGAMENTTATLHGSGVLQKPGQLIDENAWEDTIAHELFHHWFGDLVTAESWSNLTVNESFANYSEYLWNEYKYGKDQADYHQMTDVNMYIHNPGDFKKDLVRFNYDSREDVFDLVTYQKGGGILHMLRNYLGDDAFFAGMQDYLKTNEYQNAEAHQLRLSFEKVSGKDLNWFFNQWYFGSGNPKIKYSYTFEPVKKQVAVTIEQTQDEPFQFPLAIDVYDNGKPKRYNVWANAQAKNTFNFDVSKNPDLVNINADGVLLADITDTKTPEQYLMQFQGSKEFKSRYNALNGIKDQVGKNPAATKLLAAALKDPFFRTRIKALQLMDLSNAEQMKAMGAEVEKLATNDPKTLVQAAAIAALAKTKDKKYLPVFEKGVNAVSNAVKGSSVAAIIGIDPPRAGSLADKIDLEGAPDSMVEALLPVIVKNKVTAQMPNIAQYAAFYPFIKFQNPELGKVAEEGYNWIMTSDNLKATESITRILGQAKGQMGDNPQVKMMISQMLKDGLNKKMELLKQNPQNAASINKQIDLLNKAIADFK
ncbi:MULTISPECIES: M1 family metallopeptidase [Chryseobacterium]|uniref:Aminopeptidase N n=1 Tax=Chryseobacterium camelliae TaxID=1265445 RepID=A0ABU0TJ95_9FLAO|nr:MULTISPECIES: M1 family metallopeptidase [Chryseobacterium]MDT3409038.1 aminopeptidase N [Pseudacidovorax intermedius]MDQ1097104.1 aminopeptidase N [Chryseobacterium camelliae]MDQ1101041.1 aminopeptidase N [Chryseobacterium sp. SORGH_AS_1048]MDR6084484.1 aminopeptidase N [Chryseobacterium sp. SORGH_AS_0909]MDR6132754.1 aminopeptidase N [Chryseobacterium sp. SORGH_AS_1175]